MRVARFGVDVKAIVAFGINAALPQKKVLPSLPRACVVNHLSPTNDPTTSVAHFFRRTVNRPDGTKEPRVGV